MTQNGEFVWWLISYFSTKAFIEANVIIRIREKSIENLYKVEYIENKK
jgi:hypothetical protein